MEKEQCRPITVYMHATVTNKPVNNETVGDYTAQWNGRDYTTPQEYEGDAACTPVVYGDGCCPDAS